MCGVTCEYLDRGYLVLDTVITYLVGVTFPLKAATIVGATRCASLAIFAYKIGVACYETGPRCPGGTA